MGDQLRLHLDRSTYTDTSFQPHWGPYGSSASSFHSRLFLTNMCKTTLKTLQQWFSILTDIQSGWEAFKTTLQMSTSHPLRLRFR